MIEVTVAYPAGQGRTFNMDYYLKTHIPLFQKRMGAAMKTIRVSRGIGGIRRKCRRQRGCPSCECPLKRSARNTVRYAGWWS